MINIVRKNCKYQSIIKVIVFVLLFFAFLSTLNAESFEDTIENDSIRFSHLFYKFGTNTFNSLTYNYGVNYLLSGLSTYYFVHSGADWKWRNTADGSSWLPFVGMPFAIVGAVLPLTLPLVFYISGSKNSNTDLQITGLAIGQAAIQGFLISSTMKAFTGRLEPKIDPFGGSSQYADFSDDFAFGFFNRGIFNGWPSSHTAVISAMAVAWSELYPDNLGLKIGAYLFAAATGFGMSLGAHWASDSIAGALVGYTVGKSVGASFRKLRDGHSESGAIASQGAANTMPGFQFSEKLSLIALPNHIGLGIQL